MKKIIITNVLAFSLIFISQELMAQSTSSGVGVLGHLGLGPADYLGWINNTIPLRFETFSTERMGINQNIFANPTTAAAGLQNTSGFVGINRTDPWSRLHISSSVTGQVNFGGYRPWMREGILWQSATDQIWIGDKRWGGGAQVDQQNAVINWGDDQGGFSGPDHMVFNYTETSQNNPTYPAPGIIPNPATSDGLEIMRLTNTGNVGIGPRFNNGGAAPRSTLHLHRENNQTNWLQITNQYSGFANTPQTAPTNINSTDGLHLGIDANNNAYLFNQENRHLIFSSNATTTNLNQERFRITAINTPGTSNPGGIANNTTRTSISHNPLLALDQPLSLLHLGYNLTNPLTPALTFGYRSWMDLGITVSRDNDHVYFGLKPEVNGQDAVITWGDDNVSSAGGADRFRIIFTSPLTGQPNVGPGTMQGVNGLEFMRFLPNTLNGNTVPDPRIGVGDMAATSSDPGNTFEINSVLASPVGNAAFIPGSWPASTGASGLRFSDLTSASTPVPNGTGGVNDQKVLTVDQNGDVVLVKPGGNAGADNGLSTNGPTPGLIHLGQNVGGAGGQLLNDREIPLSGFGIYFNGDVSTTGEKIEVGDNTILTTIPNRFNAQSKTVRVTGLFVNATPAGANPSNSTIGVAGFKLNGTSNNNIGVRGTGEVDPTYAGPGNPIGIGVKGEGHNTAQSVTNAMAIGVWGQSVNPAGQFNIGGFFDAGHQGGTNGMNVAIYGSVAPTASVNIAVYGTAAPAAFSATVPSGPFPVTGTYAGYFNGNVVRTGNDNFTSDKNLKQNIDSIQNAISILNQLKPKTFDYKLASYPSMNLPSGKQYGLLAQDVEVILPELVNNLAHPAQFDSLGVVNVPSFTYKSLEYQQLIPLLIRGIQEQQKVIDCLKTKTSKQDSINNAVQAQIAALTSSVSSCCSSTTVRTTKAEELNQLNINLNDNDVIVLNQNVPNPFAEQTTITYNVPEKYGYAQIIFSTIDGRILKTVDITKKGRGQLNVFANDLGNGLYTYSLIVDGKVIDTKKMVKGE